MGTEEAAAARFPARRRLAGGGDGVQGRELTELYLGVGDVVDGDGRSRIGGGAERSAAVASCDGGAPAREEGQGQAGELHGAMRKLARGSIGVGEGR